MPEHDRGSLVVLRQQRDGLRIGLETKGAAPDTQKQRQQPERDATPAADFIDGD